LNLILIYLRATLTAHRPITKLAHVRRKKQQQNTYKQNTKQGSLYGNSSSSSTSSGSINSIKINNNNNFNSIVISLHANNSIPLFKCLPTASGL
jgi:hypothetical protein